jgi:predicted dehydrogenase
MAKKIKFGILGTGKIASKFALGLSTVDEAELYAVGSRTQESSAAFAEKHKVPKPYASYENLAKDSEVDIIYIATPHNLHYENTILCLNQNKHVICEKPFAVNAKEVNAMIKLANEKNLFLMEALWSRFMPHIIKAKELINEGIIGDVKLLTSDFCMKPKFDPDSRLFNKDLIGGSLMDIGIYPVFLAYHILGKPSKIQALAGFGKTGVDENCSISFGYDDEKLAVLYSSMKSTNGVNAIIEGDKGKIIFESPWHAPSNFTLLLDNGHKEHFTFDQSINGYNYEAQEVVNCLHAGKTQSDIWSWQNSLDLIELLDDIRFKAEIRYPKHDQKQN